MNHSPLAKPTKQQLAWQDLELDMFCHLPALDSDTHRKLKRLALACDTNKTQLAAEIIKITVNHPDFIKWLQDKHPGPKEFRIVPVRNYDGRIEY